MHHTTRHNPPPKARAQRKPDRDAARRRILRPAAALLPLLALAGCQTARVERPLTATLGGNEPEQQMEFWHALPEEPVTGNDDAFHGLLLYFDGEDPADGYEARRRALIDRGWLPAGFDEPADRAVSRGTLAVILCHALEIEGGLTMRLLGPTPRYATRELQHVGVFPLSDPHQTFSGNQFVSLIGRVEDYRRRQAAENTVASAGSSSEDEP